MRRLRDPGALMFKIAAFLLVLALALALFTRTMTKLVRIAALGKPANLQETWLVFSRPSGTRRRRHSPPSRNCQPA